jgi:hypothetical protein
MIKAKEMQPQMMYVIKSLRPALSQLFRVVRVEDQSTRF